MITGEYIGMNAGHRLSHEQFPRSSQYHPDWVLANASGGANSLWLTEWLTTALDLRAGMRVFDLGCGRASSSIFLRREFGVQVWATDLWFSAPKTFSAFATLELGTVCFHCMPMHGAAIRPRFFRCHRLRRRLSLFRDGCFIPQLPGSFCQIGLPDRNRGSGTDSGN